MLRLGVPITTARRNRSIGHLVHIDFAYSYSPVMDMLGRLLRGFLVVACALFGLGAGLCSLGFLPSLLGSVFQGRGFDGGLAFLIINLLGFAIAGGSFYLIVKILKDRRQPNPIPRYTSHRPPGSDSDPPPPPG